MNGRNRNRVVVLAVLGVVWTGLFALRAEAADAGHRYFKIVVVDAESGEPVQSVRLRTTGQISLVTDAKGVAAFYEPGLMGLDVFFHVSAQGYEYRKDGFGFRGVRLKCVEGGSAVVKVRRSDEPAAKEKAFIRDSLLADGPVPGRKECFRITAVDEATGRGVPLVEFRVDDRIRYVTDSAGVAAFHEPSLMGRNVRFAVGSHGYRLSGKADEVTLRAVAGGKAVVKMTREIIAQRLYRITGGGIYRDSVLLGLPAPTKRPVVNGLVMGQDTVFNAVYGGRIFWLWGDTNRPAYPLGQYWVSSAVSELPSAGGLDPNVGIDLEYFVDAKGFSRPMARMSGPGLATWLGGLHTQTDRAGRERLFAYYGNFKGLQRKEAGLVVYDDEKQAFQRVATFDLAGPFIPGGHVMKVRCGGTEYLYFCSRFLRVPAAPAKLADIANYEAFTCLAEGTRADDGKLDRDSAGRIRYRWKPNTPPVIQRITRLKDPKSPVKPAEALLHFRDPIEGKHVSMHGGSVRWNPYRGRYVMIFLENFGTSALGEVWYAEAETPVGPWVYARKVVTHDNYTFYNVVHHDIFDQDGGRTIYFEGTYTKTFSGNPNPTPRYNYNQMMYKLDLADPRLALPAAVYDLSPQSDPAGRFGRAADLRKAAKEYPLAFFAPDRSFEGGVAVRQVKADAGGWALKLGKADAAGARPVFYALPPDHPNPPKTTQPLYELRNTRTGQRAYTVDADWRRAGFERTEKPICHVWRNPMAFHLPVLPYEEASTTREERRMRHRETEG